MVGDERSDIVRVPCVEVPRVDPPVVSIVLFFASCSMRSSICIAVIITVSCIALSVSFSVSVTILFSLHIKISSVTSSFSLSEVIFGSVVFSVILNFSALLCFSGFSSVVTLGLLLVSSSHVPLGDRMAESL